MAYAILYLLSLMRRESAVHAFVLQVSVQPTNKLVVL
jgi:hypothetical protein